MAAIGCALAAALTLSACQITSPLTTTQSYDPADGVSVNVGPIAVRDLLVVSEGNGAAGVVSGQVVNTGDEPAEITLSTNQDGQATTLAPTVTVDPGASTRLDGQGPNGSGTPVVIPVVGAAPGGILQITVQSSLGQADSGTAPVMLPEGPYADLVAPTENISQ